MNPRAPISGTEYVIGGHGYSASIVSVGATLRSLTHQATDAATPRDLIVPFAMDELRPAYRGAILAPWPNRVIDGVYDFGGAHHVLALTEPARGHALHGLVVWEHFDAIEVAADRVVLASEIQPQSGYPWRLRIEVEYRISATGLATEVRASNLSHTAAPFGTGPHPYLVAGEGRVDDWLLSLPATHVVTITPERLLPIDYIETPKELSFAEARPIGDVFIDHAYSGLARDSENSATVLVTTAAGGGVGIRWGAELPWVQIHTADQDDPATSRRGLAVEPMTCPPDAFNSEIDLVVIEPWGTADAGWEIFAV